jgi:hypothetical protein
MIGPAIKHFEDSLKDTFKELNNQLINIKKSNRKKDKQIDEKIIKLANRLDKKLNKKQKLLNEIRLCTETSKTGFQTKHTRTRTNNYTLNDLSYNM